MKIPFDELELFVGKILTVVDKMGRFTGKLIAHKNGKSYELRNGSGAYLMADWCYNWDEVFPEKQFEKTEDIPT